MTGRATRAIDAGRRAAMVFAFSAVGVSFAPSALAAPPTVPSKGECVDADTQAQSLRRDGKLARARAQLQVCADDACPKIVRDDCAQRIDELNRAQPTITFAATDGSGNDLSAVKVTMDGAPFADKLDGSSLAVDPGEHDFTFVAAGQSPVTRHIVVHEGEKARREAVTLGSAPGPQAAPAVVAAPVTPTPNPEPAVASPSGPSSSSRGSAQRIAGVALGGAGVVGVVVGAIFGAKASSDFSAQKTACSSTSCTPQNHALAVNDHGDATSAGAISTVAFIAGGVFLAGGITLFVMPPKAHDGSSSTALSMAPSLGPGGGGMLLRGSF